MSHLKILMVAIFVFTSSILQIGKVNAADTSSFVDPHVILQDNFQGWGTSLAWWADVVGGMESEIVDHVVDALFSPSKLNLNILRYVIGGTTPNNYTCGEYRDGAATESFKDGPDSSFIWNRDLRQRKILQLAKSKGANTFEAFSNTPPQWMTISGCSKGNPARPPLHPNFDPANAPLFAYYATEVINYFHEVLNISFTSYSPFNEPFGLHGIGSWAGSIQSQEGCNMDRATMVSVIRSMSEAIAAKNLNFVSIAISDETQVNTQVQSYDYFESNGVGELFQQVNVHGYWDNVEVSRRDLLSMKCAKRGQKLWMDEMGWGGTPVGNMGQGLNLASRVLLDLRQMLPSAWVYWQVVEGGGGWGLMEVPYTNTSLENIVYNSGYYALEQFSQHIRKGYRLIYTSDENTIGAFSESERKLVIVIVNSEDSQSSHEIDLSLLDTVGSASLYRTSTSEQHTNLPPPTISTGKKIEILSPPLSISTLEITNVSFTSSPKNLILNGNFEDVDEQESGTYPRNWIVRTVGDSGGAVRAGATNVNAWRDEYSGFLEIGQTWNSALIQNFTLEGTQNAACSLYLTAWCSSTRAGTAIEVYIDDDEGPSVTIDNDGAYKMYGLKFSAKVGADIRIMFYGSVTPLLSGVAKIDNVSVHARCDI